MYRDVLVPTDGSDGTRRAIGHALDLANAFDGTVHALAVVPDGPYGGDESDDREAAERAVSRVAAEADRRDVDATTAIRGGAPADEILAYADDAGVDAIVMGTHARTGLDRLIVGSVTEQVVRTADVPVVTVRMDEEIEIADAERAEEVALEALAEAGHEDPRIVDEPYRTSASWVVPVESASGAGNVHVDAVTGEARVGTVERE